MDTTDKQIENHISEMLKMQNDHQERPLSLEELKELSISMGNTEEGWNQMMIDADKLFIEGKSHISRQNYPDAVIALTKAVNINPYLPQAHGYLSLALWRNYLDLNIPNDADLAEKFASKALELNSSDKNALNVLGALNKSNLSETHEKTIAKNYKKLIWAIVIALVVIIGGVYIFTSRTNSTIEEQNYQQREIINANSDAARINAEEAIFEAWSNIQMQINRRKQILIELKKISSNDQLSSTVENLESTFPKQTNSQDITHDYIKEQTEWNNEVSAKAFDFRNSDAFESNDMLQSKIIELEGTQNRIAALGKIYNDRIRQYNTIVKSSIDSDDLPTYPYFLFN